MMSNILVLIPTLNEEKGLPEILAKTKRHKLATVVLDGGSSDQTREIAKNSDALFIEAPKGKGKAFQFFLSHHFHLLKNFTHLLMIDGDGTYDLEEYPLLCEHAQNDMVIGKRKRVDGFENPLRSLGNTFLRSTFRMLYEKPTPDLLSGFRLMKTDRLKHISFDYQEFELETELTARFIKNNWSITWANVTYSRRKGNSKLRPFRDGWKIYRCMKKILQENDKGAAS